MFSVDQVIVWIVVGLLGGGLAGALMTWERGGFGLWRNLALGLSGAIIGGLLFRIFGIWPGLDKSCATLFLPLWARCLCLLRSGCGASSGRHVKTRDSCSPRMTWRG
jgi:uncharacterized membrane protein YeaQ/YmgE (transglycosylase-associated protein family)